MMFCVPVLIYGTNWSNLKQRYLEHTRYIKWNNPQSAFALHVIQNIHEHGPLQDSTALLQHAYKEVRMYALEQFYMQQNKLIPEQHSGDRNPLFDLGYDLQLKQATTWRNTHLLQFQYLFGHQNVKLTSSWYGVNKQPSHCQCIIKLTKHF